ncbi:MAG: hypothetical protein CL608_04535 [Anaerolineaceae bacterium]|nr:hypothetical protein [Anaerolineaceae bacterium]
MKRKELRRSIAKHFKDDELRTLCFDLELDYELLGGEGKMGKIRELIAHMDRHNRLAELLQYLKTERPKISWPDIPATPIQEKKENPIRVAVWNALYRTLWKKKTLLHSYKSRPPLIERFSVDLWADFINKPIDSRPEEPMQILNEIRIYFFSYSDARWRNYLEYILNYWNDLNHYKPEPINQAVNLALDREKAGLKYVPQYEFNRFVSGAIVEAGHSQSTASSLLPSIRQSQITPLADIPDNILKVINERAEKRHPDDFSTRKYVIDKEIQAWHELQNYQAHDVPNEVLASIFRRAEQRHTDDFSTRKYVVENEVKAWRDLNKK